jgi:hypothetical protein
MKKLITGFISLLAFVAIPANQLNAQGCPHMVNIVQNPDFSLGNTLFGSMLNNFSGLCNTNEYLVTTDFQNKCNSWTSVTGAGNFMIIDGPTGGGAINVWSQTVNICPNTAYTFSFSGRNVYTTNLFPVNFVINGTTYAGTNITGGGWNTYSMIWNSGATPPPSVTIALSIANGSTYRDFAIDDIFFGYCDNLGVTHPATICNGSCVGLTATGAANYTWSNGATAPSILVCPTATTVYSVTGTDAGGCLTFGPLSTTVTVNPTPTVTATATPGTLTPPSYTTSALTATASGGTGLTYSWSPSGTLNSASIANPIATPTTTTVYTVTVTNAEGCSSSATVQVTVNPQSMCTLPYNYTIPAGSSASTFFPSMSGVSGQNIHIFGVFTVDVSFNFGGCNIVMEPNSRIEVASGALLLITNRTHIYACDSMWDGINLQNGANAQIVNASIIEDAVSAVTINQGSTATIDQCVFNRNYTAVTLTANTSATSPLAMTNCMVTCRDLALSAVLTSNPTSATVWAGLVAGTYPAMNMKWPFFAYKSIYGVDATDVNMLQVGNPASSAIFNGFENLSAAGIHSLRTNTIVYNNKFRNITSAVNCFSCTPLIGTGVYGGGSTTGVYAMKVGGTLANQLNEFYNVNTSIDIYQYTSSFVLNNIIYNTSSTTALYGGYGKVGVRVTPAANNTVNVNGNTITDAASAIVVNRNNTTATQTVTLTVDNNWIVANSTGFCNTGISVTDPASGVTLSSTLSEINNNTIVEASTCINLLNMKTKNIVYYNSCLTRYAATGSINGIKLNNTMYTDVLQNHTKSTVAGTNATAYGIYLLNSPSNTVRCNTIEDASRSLVFSGNCLNTHAYTQNTFRRAVDGIVLLTGSTVIGTQGTTAVPSNNYWDMTFPMTNQIWAAAGTTVNLIVTTGGVSSAVTQPTSWTGGGTVAITTTASTVAACGAVPARLAQEETISPTSGTWITPLIVSPNPNNGQFTVTADYPGLKDVMVYDMNGRLVFSQMQTTETNIAVDISSEAKGLYLVKVVAESEVQIVKISKQ